MAKSHPTSKQRWFLVAINNTFKQIGINWKKPAKPIFFNFVQQCLFFFFKYFCKNERGRRQWSVDHWSNCSSSYHNTVCFFVYSLSGLRFFLGPTLVLYYFHIYLLSCYFTITHLSQMKSKCDKKWHTRLQPSVSLTCVSFREMKTYSESRIKLRNMQI